MTDNKSNRNNKATVIDFTQIYRICCHKDDI